MKIRKTKKGFTIVELVIVIAVIGVLTAILVPTFISLTAKANKASDQSLVANLNTALKMQEAEDGAKNPTMHDAVLDLAEQGFDLAKLVTKSNQDLLWNSKTNQFELAKEQEGAEYWKIFDSATSAANSKVSVYAKDSFGSEITLTGVGFDAGYVTTVSTINYEGGAGSDVVIRTNGAYTTLNIDAAEDSVQHYGNANVINVTAVAMNSYHEKGSVARLNAKAGRIDVEPGAFVGVIAVDKDATTSELKVENNGTVFGTEVITYNSENMEHTVIENPSEEQKAIVNTITTTSSTDTIRISTADALINIASAQSQGIIGGSLKIELTSDIDLTGKTWIPFGADLTVDEHHEFNGSIDGKNHNIIGLSNGAYRGVQLANHTTGQIGEHYGFIANSGEVSLSNINFKSVNIDSDNATVCAAVIAYAEESNITLNNVNVEGKITGSDKVAGLIGYAKVNTTVVISGCSVKADILAHEYRVGGFFGFASHADITIENSSFSGSVSYENNGKQKTIYCAAIGSVHSTKGGTTALNVSNFTLNTSTIQSNTGLAVGKFVSSSAGAVLVAMMNGTIARTGITDNVVSAQQWSVILTSSN